MTIDEAVDFFGSAGKLAKALGITPQYVTNWRSTTGKIPLKHQLILEHITEKALTMSDNIEDILPSKRTIPAKLQKQFDQYVLNKKAPKPFVRAFLENDLSIALKEAQGFASTSRLKEMMDYMEQHVPETLRGSKEMVRAHLKEKK